MTTPPYRVGIIGLGNIAIGYDRPHGETIQTHVKACLSEPRLRLVAISDRDLSRASSVRSDWGLTAEVVAPEEFFQRELDVMCISTPDDTHLDLLAQALTRPPRLLMCEKPVARDAEAAGRRMLALQRRGCSVAVNHLRRWIPGLREWIAEAGAGAFGRALGATAHYSTGFWRNGLHAVDLIAAFMSERLVDVRCWGDTSPQTRSDDPLLTATITLQAGDGVAPVWLHGLDGRRQTIFDTEILFEAARIRIEDLDGICARLDRPEPLMLSEFAPELRPVVEFHDRPPRLMAAVWSNLADHLENGAPLGCSGMDAMASLRLCAAIAASAGDEPGGTNGSDGPRRSPSRYR